MSSQPPIPPKKFQDTSLTIPPLYAPSQKRGSWKDEARGGGGN